jgi:hypothetical protein
MSSRILVRVVLACAAVLGTVAAAAQLQHLAWSTARVENASTHPVKGVTLVVDDARVGLGGLSPGRSRFVVLPDRGDASLSVELSALGTVRTGCSEYVQGDMYHVRIRISDAVRISCSTELGIFTTRLMLFEMF